MGWNIRRSFAPTDSDAKKLVRLMTNSNYLAHTKPLFKLLNILKVKDVHRHVLAQHIYKEKQSGFIQPGGLHDYGTRGQMDVRPAYQRLSLTQHSIYYAGPLVWNSLPNFIKDSDTLNTFKRNIKKYVIDGYHHLGVLN